MGAAAYKVSIKKWSVEDRPREKLFRLGRRALSDAELLAILLGSGSRDQSALELSKTILSAVKNNLGELGRLDSHALMKFKGIGSAKAITVLAALELGRRRKDENTSEKPAIRTSHDAYVLLQPHLADLDHEEFWILLLNRANMVIDQLRISSGGISGTIADIRMIFKQAIDKLASGIILSHNHPSGNVKPSKEDMALTKKIKSGAELLEINILDHLIITNNAYYSLADHGEL